MRLAFLAVATLLGASLVWADDYYSSAYDAWDPPPVYQRQAVGTGGGAGAGTISLRPNPAGIAILLSALAVGPHLLDSFTFHYFLPTYMIL